MREKLIQKREGVSSFAFFFFSVRCVDLQNIHNLKVESYVLFGGKF